MALAHYKQSKTLEQAVAWSAGGQRVAAAVTRPDKPEIRGSAVAGTGWESNSEIKELVKGPGELGTRGRTQLGRGSPGVWGAEPIDRQRKKDRAERVGARYDWWIGEARGNASTGGLVRRALPQ